MRLLDMLSDAILLRYQIKQRRDDYEEEMMNGATFDQLKAIQTEIRELERKREFALTDVEELYELT